MKQLSENLNETQCNYIAPFVWLHGENDKLIVDELDRIYDSGIRSVCLESRTHEDFCRDAWWDDIKLIFDECKKRDMQVWILDDKHFPSGYANGIFENKYKHLQAFGITEYHLDVAGPITDGAAMAGCWKIEEDDEIIAVAAIKHIPNSDKYTSDIIDLTNGLSDGLVYFSLPEGCWRIVFLVKTRTGIAERFRPFCDRLNPYTTDLYINEVYEPHYYRFKEYFGNTFLGFFSDEPSFLNNTASSNFHTPIGEPFIHFPWNDALPQKIGIAPSQLVKLWFDFENNQSAGIRKKFMDCISTEYQNNYCKRLADWCHNRDIMYIGHIIEDNNIHAESGYGPGHYFRALDWQDMSGIDVVLHQIVPGLTEVSNSGYVAYKHMNNDFFHYSLAKLGSSFAHIDKRKQGRAMCEIFGAYGWAEGTKIMKYLTDHMLVRGINYFVPHAFSPKLNDTDCPPNFYDSGNNPQYKYFKLIMNYMNRCCHMLQGGTHIPTCAILYDAEARWTTKNFLPLEKCAKVLYDNILDYDIIPIDYLNKIDENGFLNGEKYPLLIVPYYDTLPAETADLLKSLPINVIVAVESDCLIDGFNTISLSELAAYMEDYRDIYADYNGIYLRYYHYRISDTDIYMFNNEDINNTIKTNLSLSGFSGGNYIEYDAFENKAYSKLSSDGNIELILAPYHSIMIILGDADGIDPYKPICKGPSKELTPAFNISVKEERHTEYTSINVTDKLFNITGKGSLPHFSGMIKYESTFELEHQGKYLLDLGKVGETAELYINNKPVGIKIIPPYQFDISEYIVQGENSIKILVSTTNAYERRDAFSKFLMFEPTGLLGPITLTEYHNY